MLSETQTYKKILRVQIGMIILMSVCLLPILFKPCIWYDESFTINIVRKPLSELLRITALDVHPPLYYLVVKLFVGVLGDHIWVYHLPSLLFYIALLILTALFFSKYFDARMSLLVTAAFCSLPNMIKYALELRMYSMSMLLILSGLYVSYIIIKTSDDNAGISWKSLRFWLLLALINVSAAYTHYFAGVAAIGTSLFLLLYFVMKYGLKTKVHYMCWGIYCIAMALLYLPWIPVLLSQMSAVNENYWISPLTEASLHESPEIIFLTSSGLMSMTLKVVFLLGIFIFIAHLTKSRQYFWLAGCYFVVGFWLLLVISYSLIKSPVFVDRYLIMLLPLIWIPAVAGYVFIDKGCICHILLTLFAFCFILNYEEQYTWYISSSDKQLTDFGSQNISDDDVFFHFYIQTLSICDAYFPNHEHYMLLGALESEKALSELTGCHQIESVDELLSVPGNIWCLNGDYLQLFVDAGFQMETYSLGTGQIYRIYKTNE